MGGRTLVYDVPTLGDEDVGHRRMAEIALGDVELVARSWGSLPIAVVRLGQSRKGAPREELVHAFPCLVLCDDCARVEEGGE